jgi:hypothetical protein
MKHATAIMAACLLLTLSALHLCAGERIRPIKEWSGTIRDGALRKAAPQRGFLTDNKAWAKLWKTWRPKDELPAVDFTKEFIIVTTVAGVANVHVSEGKLDQQGSLNVPASATKAEGPGFGYSIAVFSRKGVKSYRGKPLLQD